MGGLYALSTSGRPWRLSFLGISVAGALAHNLTQLYLAYIILIRHNGIFFMLPWLCLGSLLTGWITSMIACGVCRRIENMGSCESLRPILDSHPIASLKHFYHTDTSWFHRLTAETKLLGVLAVSLSLFAFQNARFYVGLSVFLAGLMYLSSIPAALFLKYLRRYGILIALAFLLPLSKGISAGTSAGLRVFLFIWAGFLLTLTTRPEDLMRVLARLSAPLRILGFSQNTLASVFSSSWAMVPLIWGRAQEHFSLTQLKNLRSPGRLSSHMSDFIACLYCETEQKNKLSSISRKHVL